MAKKRTSEHAKPLSESIAKELAGVERYLKLNLRVKIEKNKSKNDEEKDEKDDKDEKEEEKKNKEENQKPSSIHLEIYKKWTDHEETCAEKFEKIEEERRVWDDIIAKYEKTA